VEVQLHAFLTSALDGGEWSASCPGRFTPSETAPSTHWIGGWVGHRAVLDAVVKREISTPTGNGTLEPRLSSSQNSRYTDWAIVVLYGREIWYVNVMEEKCDHFIAMWWTESNKSRTEKNTYWGASPNIVTVIKEWDGQACSTYGVDVKYKILVTKTWRVEITWET
jgi:hypothetical protein